MDLQWTTKPSYHWEPEAGPKTTNIHMRSKIVVSILSSNINWENEKRQKETTHSWLGTGENNAEGLKYFGVIATLPFMKRVTEKKKYYTIKHT